MTKTCEKVAHSFRHSSFVRYDTSITLENNAPVFRISGFVKFLLKTIAFSHGFANIGCNEFRSCLFRRFLIMITRACMVINKTIVKSVPPKGVEVFSQILQKYSNHKANSLYCFFSEKLCG